MSPEAAGTRLDRFLQQHAADLSRTRLQALIAAGRVAVDGQRRKASHRLRAGDSVVVEVPAPAPLGLSPEAMDLDIVYEDQAVLVINKPAGLVVHPGAGHTTGTLVHALLWHCGASLSGIGGARRPGIVHRLDRGTSGLLVVAKSDQAHLALSRQLKARSVERCYLALVHGTVPHAAGVVEGAIGRDPRDRRRMAVRPPGAGRIALTRYRVLERFQVPGPLTLLAVELGTGRTHQIRVHLAHLGFPVVGDPTYRRRTAALADPDFAAQVTALEGVALHAAVLGFTHPETGARLRFEAPPPPAFEALLAALRRGRTDGGKPGGGQRPLRDTPQRGRAAKGRARSGTPRP